jgi:5-methylcytosine-specific restriction endonuclease McrA
VSVSHLVDERLRNRRMVDARKKGTLDRILERDGFRCQYCGKTAEQAHTDGKRLAVDHVVPFSAGGDEADENLVACCMPCNSAKKNRPLAEVRHFLILRRIGWPRFTEAQIDWMRRRGVDVAEYDNGRLWLEER